MKDLLNNKLFEWLNFIHFVLRIRLISVQINFAINCYCSLAFSWRHFVQLHFQNRLKWHLLIISINTAIIDHDCVEFRVSKIPISGSIFHEQINNNGQYKMWCISCSFLNCISNSICTRHHSDPEII